MNDEVFLVTGASGCLGAWCLRELHLTGVPFVAVDLVDDRRRLSLVTDDAEAMDGVFLAVDISQPSALDKIVELHAVTNIIHLAALQIPACAADPALGAQVNVVGTVNVLETIRRSQGAVRGFSYASSVAVFNETDSREPGEDGASRSAPKTLYGCYKRAVESIASVYAESYSVGSVGLRPCVVYGPGRDQGLTSDISQALVAVAARVPAHIRYTGETTLQHAQDVATLFIAGARFVSGEAHCVDVAGPSASVDDVIATTESLVPGSADLITSSGPELPFPKAYDPLPLERLLGPVAYKPLRTGIADSIQRFSVLLERGALAAPAT
jgi:nucleoside-diphosphate-sugar epimerase